MPATLEFPLIGESLSAFELPLAYELFSSFALPLALASGPVTKPIPGFSPIDGSAKAESYDVC